MLGGNVVEDIAKGSDVIGDRLESRQSGVNRGVRVAELVVGFLKGERVEPGARPCDGPDDLGRLISCCGSASTGHDRGHGPAGERHPGPSPSVHL